MQVAAFDAITDELRLAHHQLVALGERLLEDEPVTLAQRAVIERVVLDGPATVPSIARSRGVTRQHIQVIVDGLVRDGFVVLMDNPAHRRSRLVTLTPSGTELFQRIRSRERALIERLAHRTTPDVVEVVVDELRSLRAALAATDRSDHPGGDTP